MILFFFLLLFITFASKKDSILDNRWIWRKFYSFRVKWNYGIYSAMFIRDKRNRTRYVKQAGRNESTIAERVLNQTYVIFLVGRAPQFGPNLQYNRTATVEAGELQPRPFQANRVANSSLNFVRVSGPKSCWCFVKTREKICPYLTTSTQCCISCAMRSATKQMLFF